MDDLDAMLDDPEGSAELDDRTDDADGNVEGSAPAGRGLLGQAAAFDALKRVDAVDAHIRLDGARRRAVAAMCRLPACLDYLVGRLATVTEDARKQDCLLFEAKAYAGDTGLTGNDNKRKLGVDASNLESVRTELADVATGLDLSAWSGEDSFLEHDALQRIDFSVGCLRPGSDLMREIEGVFKPLKGDVSRLCAGATALRDRLGSDFEDGESFLLGEGVERPVLNELASGGDADAAALLGDIASVEAAHRASLPLMLGSVRAHRSASGEYRRLRNEIVESNIKLIGDILARNGIYESDPHFDDMTQEGALGLLTAAERYDFSSGFQFSTYSSRWALSFVQRHKPEKGRAVRIPWVAHQKARQAVAKAAAVEAKLGRRALPGEVAQLSGIEREELSKASDVLLPCLSMDYTVGDESGDGDSFGSAMADETVDMVSDVEQEQVAKLVQRAIAMLPLAERTVLSHRYGFGARGVRPDGSDATCGEVGELVGLKKNAVRERELIAFKKLLEGPLGPALRAAVK